MPQRLQTIVLPLLPQPWKPEPESQDKAGSHPENTGLWAPLLTPGSLHVPDPVSPTQGPRGCVCVLAHTGSPEKRGTLWARRGHMHTPFLLLTRAGRQWRQSEAPLRDSLMRTGLCSKGPIFPGTPQPRGGEVVDQAPRVLRPPEMIPTSARAASAPSPGLGPRAPAPCRGGQAWPPDCPHPSRQETAGLVEGSGTCMPPLLLAACPGHAPCTEGFDRALPNRGSPLSPPHGHPPPLARGRPLPARPAFALAFGQTPECACRLHAAVLGTGTTKHRLSLRHGWAGAQSHA